MSLELENTIQPEQRFAHHGKNEYNVFSHVHTDAAEIENWTAVARPTPVLIDPDTYETLRNKRIEWVFDDKKVLVACRVTGGEQKS
mgnify:FL=1|tara:strand:- start:230 stop:487 length:258 start_codon:yes stop_codon:yes gene_type:complete